MIPQKYKAETGIKSCTAFLSVGCRLLPLKLSGQKMHFYNLWLGTTSFRIRQSSLPPWFLTPWNSNFKFILLPHKTTTHGAKKIPLFMGLSLAFYFISISRSWQILWEAFNRNRIYFEKVLWHGQELWHTGLSFLEDFHAGPHNLTLWTAKLVVSPLLPA